MLANYPLSMAGELKTVHNFTYIFLFLFNVEQVESLESRFHPIRHKLYKTQMSAITYP